MVDSTILLGRVTVRGQPSFPRKDFVRRVAFEKQMRVAFVWATQVWEWNRQASEYSITADMTPSLSANWRLC